jgi:hypothetical protein
MKLNEDEIEVLNELSKDISLENYFFKRVKDIKWFFELKDRGYFNPDRLPRPMSAKQEHVEYTPNWNILPYLEKVAEQVQSPETRIYRAEIINIIKSIHQFQEDNPKIEISAWTWVSFNQILLSIPNAEIPYSVLKYVNIWIKKSYTSTLSHDIFKLIIKFLPEKQSKEDIKKAELLLDTVTIYEWEKDKRKLSKEFIEIFGEDNAKANTLIDPYWILDGFERINKLVAEKCSNNFIYLLSERIVQILTSLNKKKHYDAELKSTPIKISLNRYSKGKAHIHIESKKDQKDGLKKIVIRIENILDRDHYSSNISSELSKLNLDHKYYEQLLKILIDIYKDIFEDYSYIWYKSLHDKPHLRPTEAEHIFIVILRDILHFKANISPNDVNNILDDYLKNRFHYTIFQRLALYIIGDYWKKYRHLFWDFLKTDPSLFERYPLESELYILLKNNANMLNEKEKKIIKSAILRSNNKFDESANREFRLDLWKQKWFSALKSIPDFLEIYDKLKKSTNVKEKIDFKGTETRYGFGSSPLDQEEVLSKTNVQLSQFLKNFKTENTWDGPSIESLANIMKIAVKKKPLKFSNNLNPFLGIGYLYVYEILDGFIQAWQDKIELHWKNIFKFVDDYIDQQDFWDDKYTLQEEWNADHKWVVKKIGELIQEGSQKDENSFPESVIPKSVDILFKILDRYKSKDENILDNDPLNYTLNSPIGKIIVALLYVALRDARLKDKLGDKRNILWNKHIKVKFDELISYKIAETYTIIGQYMLNFNYLDKSWVKQKIDDFKNIEDDDIWRWFMSGYLYLNRISKDMYQNMNFHYSRSIEFDFNNRDTDENLVQHLCVGYIYDYDLSKNTSLFSKMMDKWDHNQISNAINFFWRDEESFRHLEKIKRANLQIKERTQNFINKITSFWRDVYTKSQTKEELIANDKIVISDLSRLVVYIPKITEENYLWLMFVAKYSHINYNTVYFVQYLSELLRRDRRKESKRAIGKIYIELLNHSVPTYKKEYILSIIETLFRSKDSEANNIARQICDIYVKSNQPEVIAEVGDKYI